MTLVRLAFIVVAAGLGVYALTRDLEGFRDAIWLVGVPRFGIALLIVVAGLVASAEVWRLAVASVAGPIPPRAARRVFFVSQLGKYVPGGLWTIAAQVDMARAHGLRRSSMGVGALLFLAFHFATGVALAAVLLGIGMPGLLGEQPWIIAVVAVAMIGLIPPVLSRAVNLGLQALRQPKLSRPLGFRDVIPAVSWMLVVWACLGAATFVVAEPLLRSGDRIELLAVSTGGFALAWVVGVLVVPAPAGVGAREVAFVFALAPTLGATAATSIAVLLRVIHTVSDLSLAALAHWGRPRVGQR